MGINENDYHYQKDLRGFGGICINTIQMFG